MNKEQFLIHQFQIAESLGDMDRCERLLKKMFDLAQQEDADPDLVFYLLELIEQYTDLDLFKGIPEWQIDFIRNLAEREF